MLDLSFWKMVRSHTWSDNTTLYFVERNGLYFVVLENPDGLVLDTYSSFEKSYASSKYNVLKNKLMKNHTEWFEEI